MQYLKLSIFFSSLFLILNANGSFSDNDCVRQSFSSAVEHKSFIFGLLKNSISLEKSSCILKIFYIKWNYLKTDWEIDICRTPVHIKEIGHGIDVSKRQAICDGRNDSFCKVYRKISLVLQDDGLIFADGDKEDLSSEHGKLYCSHLVLKKYLNDGFVFSLSQDYSNTLNPIHLLKTNTELPQTQSENIDTFQIDKDAGPGDF